MRRKGCIQSMCLCVLKFYLEPFLGIYTISAITLLFVVNNNQKNRIYLISVPNSFVCLFQSESGATASDSGSRRRRCHRFEWKASRWRPESSAIPLGTSQPNRRRAWLRRLRVLITFVYCVTNNNRSSMLSGLAVLRQLVFYSQLDTQVIHGDLPLPVCRYEVLAETKVLFLLYFKFVLPIFQF